MKNMKLFEQHSVNFFHDLGLTHSFWQVNVHTIINTWVVLGLIVILVLAARYYLNKENSIGQFLVLSLIKNFKAQVIESIGKFYFSHFAFVTSLFIFIFLCNIVSLIPYIEEPTIDLNTTLGLGLVSFIYVHANSIKAHGLVEYIKGYFFPFFLLMPVNVIGTLATIISISFRLFGNIFGGAIINSLFTHAISGSILLETAGILSGINIILAMFFVLFEGFIQAFVFSMLSLTYLAIEIQEEE